MDRVVAAWKQIEQALGPTGIKRLRPPATPRAIAQLEKALGRRIPAELAASLAIHDGTRGYELLWSNEQLLGTTRIAARARMMNELVADGHFGTDHWSPSWIPLTDADGDGYCLDGRDVILFRNSGKASKLRGGFIAWLATVAKEIRAEHRDEQVNAELLGAPDASLPKRARDRLARIDNEIAGLILYLESAPTRERALRYHPISRLPALDVLTRAIERGFLTDKRGKLTITATGKKLRY